jgi:hypothetical protein
MALDGGECEECTCLVVAWDPCWCQASWTRTLVPCLITLILSRTARNISLGIKLLPGSLAVYRMALGNQLAGNQPVYQPPLAQVGGGGGGGTIVPPPAPTPVYYSLWAVRIQWWRLWRFTSLCTAGIPSRSVIYLSLVSSIPPRITRA